MCWLKRPIPLGGEGGAFGCAWRAGLFAGLFAAFFAAGRLRAGPSSSQPTSSLPSSVRPWMNPPSMRETLTSENDDAWRTRGQGRLIDREEGNHKLFTSSDTWNKRKGAL